MGADRLAAETDPIARVLPLLPLPHLDREFDYLIPRELDADARPGEIGRAHV